MEYENIFKSMLCQLQITNLRRKRYNLKNLFDLSNDVIMLHVKCQLTI